MMLRFLLFAALFFSSVCGNGVWVQFQNESIRLRTGNSTTVTATFGAPNEHFFESFTIEITCEDVDICVFDNSTHAIDFSRSADGLVSIKFVLKGLFLGYTVPKIRVIDSNISLRLERKLDIVILRSDMGKTLSDIFTYVITVMITVNIFVMGTQLDIKIIKEVVKTPTGPVIGFCCQYILMPLISFTYAWFILDGFKPLQFGYFAVGCSPGGGMSNFWTILLEGNLDLSVTMTFFSNVAALGMLPLWIYTLGRQFFSGDVSIPFLTLAQSLIVLIIPAAFGMVLIYFKPNLVTKFKKILKIITLLIILIALPFGIYANLFIFSLIRWYTVICGFMLPWTGYLLSYVASYLLKQQHRECRTIAIETGIQNGMIAILICRLSLPEPESDLTMVMPVCVSMFTSLPLWFGLVFLKWNKRKQQTKVVSVRHINVVEVDLKSPDDPKSPIKEREVV